MMNQGRRMAASGKKARKWCGKIPADAGKSEKHGGNKNAA
jgi:hypothetical protein